MPKKIISLSFSRLQDLECPYLFYKKHITKEFKEPETDAMIVGRQVAELLKEYREGCFKAGCGMSKDLMWSIFEKKGRAGGIKDLEKTKSLMDTFMRSTCAEIPLTADYVMIERKLAFDMDLKPIIAQKEDDAWYAPGAAFRMISDFTFVAGDTLRVIDDKTGHADPDPLQLHIAGYLLPKVLIEVAPKLKPWWFHGSFNIISTPPREDNLDVCEIRSLSHIGDMIRAKLKDANTRDWANDHGPIPCGRCRYCRIDDCPVRADASTAIAEIASAPAQIKEPGKWFSEVARILKDGLATMPEAETLLLFRLQLDSLYDAVQEELKKYVNTSQKVVSAAGMIAQYENVEKWTIEDLGGLLDMLIGFGATREQLLTYLKIGKTDFNKMVKKLNLSEYMPFIDQYIKRSSYRKFSVVKEKF